MGGAMRCGSAAITDGSLSRGKVADPSALARVLQHLMARTEVTQTRALVVAADSLATFRVLRSTGAPTPRDVDALVSRELQFDPERMSTHWIDVSAANGQPAVYAAAWDRSLLRNLVDTVKFAGLEPTAVELKSISVARTFPVPSGILVDLVAEPSEIVLIHQHLPRVWHSFDIPKPRSDDPVPSLAGPLRSVLRFYRRQNEGKFDATHPVLIAAEQALSASLLNDLSVQIEQPVQPLPAPTRVPPNVRHVSYLACLGQLMKRAS